jgi:cytochrome c-type biogenesis protein CcmH/NrfG
MSKEAALFAVSGAFFGLLVGWILGSQQATGTAPVGAPVAQTQATAPQPAAPAPKPVDPQKVRQLESSAQAAPADASPRVELGNMYFDAEQYGEAIRWYEDALRVDAKNVNVSTDLGVAYYYTSQPDRALAQFDRSLSLDPNHTKTLLNQGIVRAFGKQDLQAAAQSWERVVQLAPDSEEGRAARRALDAVRNAHPDLTGATPPQGAGGS